MQKVFDMKAGLETILKEHSQGVVFVCPMCKSEIVIVVTPEDVKNKKRHPGIYCPKDEQHVGILLNTGRSIDLDEILGLRSKKRP